MAYVMTSKEFVEKLKEIQKMNTIYATGMFGQKIENSIITAKAVQYPKQYSDAKVRTLRSLVGKNYYGFDCVGLVKAVLWGFPNTKYLSNNVSDFSDAGAMTLCAPTSYNMQNIEVGEILWMQGHIGVYIGNGEVIECTTNWSGNVLISRLSQRNWVKHGKLKYIDYSNTNKANTEVYKMNILKYGSTGNDVTIFESMMKKLGYYTGEIDTHFGNGCVAACNAFQTKYPECGTNGKPDGSFGPASWNKLLSLFKG